MIIYQVYPRSFQDSNGDGIGDLSGITSRLSHIASLGKVDYVWISPFFASPMKDFGYDVSDFRSVDPIFGTNEDFDRLLAEANKLGLKIMIDLVLCHTSNEHRWFKESSRDRDNPYADWYVWQNPKADGTPPNNWLSVLGGPAWHWESRRQQYYLRHFLIEQPALNWYCAEVEDEICSTVSFWLEKGVKGFRLDAVVFAHHDTELKNNPPIAHPLPSKWKEDPFMYQERKYDCGQPAGLPAMAKIRSLVDEYEGTLLLGEISERPVARKYTGPKLLNSCYFFDFLSTDTLKKEMVQTTVGDIYSDFPLGDFFWALSNHDFARHVTRLHPNKEHPSPAELKDFAKLTAALFLFLPGGYCLYQGEEFGFPAADLSYEHLVDPFDRFLWPNGQKRDLSRTPVPWNSGTKMGGFTTSDDTLLPVDSAQKAVASDTQETDSESVLNLYRTLIAWRQEYHDKSFRLSFLENSGPLTGEDWNSQSDLLKIKIDVSKHEFVGIFNLSQTKYQTAIPHTSQVLFNHNAAAQDMNTDVWNFDQLGWAIFSLGKKQKNVSAHYSNLQK